MIVSIPQFQQFFLALVRVLAILSFIPLLGGSVIPLQTRILLGVLLTLMLLPWETMEQVPNTLSLFPFTIAIGQELIIGVVAGYATALTFAAIQITGEMIGFSSGFNSGRILNPAFGEPGSTLDQFFLMISLLFFMVINGHHIMILAIQRTFSILPVNSSLPTIPIEQITRMAADLFTTGIELALPAVGALVMADITLGLLSKASPQIQVFFLGLPIKIAIGLLAVTFSLSLLHPVIIELLENTGMRMLKLLGA